MNKVSKLFSIVLATAALSFAISGCSGGGDEEPKESEGYYKGDMKPKGGGAAGNEGN